MTEQSWIVCQTEPRAEQLALSFIRHKLGIQAFYPYHIGRDKYRHYTTEPCFPGYLFCELNGHGWHPLQRAMGVCRVLLQAGVEPPTPAVLPYAFEQSVERILISRKGRAVLPVGTKVKVLAGAFAGREAFVSWSKADRRKLLFAILGGEVEVEFHVDDLAPAKDDD